MTVWLLAACMGCGYRVASHNRLPDRVGSVAVVTLDNLTTYYQVEQIMTRSLINEITRSTNWNVKNRPEEAQSVLEGEITRLAVSPVTFGRASFGSTFLVTLYAKVRMKDRRSNRVLYENNDYIFRDEYVINVDVDNFFSEMNPALERMSEDFASSLVSTILEDF